MNINPYIKMFLVILASALASGGAVAATTRDMWIIGMAIAVNVGTTLGSLLMQSPLPRKEWTDDEREAKSQPPKGPTT